VLRTVGRVSPTDPSLLVSDPDLDEAYASGSPDAVADGGEGDDQLLLAGRPPGAGTVVTCGPGADRILRSDPGALLPVDCETVQLPGAFPGALAVTEGDEDTFVRVRTAASIGTYPVRLQAGAAVFHLSCPSAARDPLFIQAFVCRGSMAVDGGPAAAFSLAKGAATDLAVPLTAADQAGLAAGIRARVTVTPPADQPGGSDPGSFPEGPIGWAAFLRG
jgi:hypothetical protein